MHRLFLDANVLFSAAYRDRAGLLALWKLKDVQLCSSRYAVEEARVNLSDDIQRERLVTLTKAMELFDGSPRPLSRGTSLPEKDVPILLGAIEAEATHLITGDLKHFGMYFGKKIAGILVMPPADYLKTYAATQETFLSLGPRPISLPQLSWIGQVPARRLRAVAYNEVIPYRMTSEELRSAINDQLTAQRIGEKRDWHQH